MRPLAPALLALAMFTLGLISVSEGAIAEAWPVCDALHKQDRNARRNCERERDAANQEFINEYVGKIREGSPEAEISRECSMQAMYYVDARKQMGIVDPVASLECHRKRLGKL